MFDYNAQFETPEYKAKQAEFMKQYRAEEDAKAKKISDDFNKRVELLKLANAELKAENDAAEAKEYTRLYESSKARYIAAGYSDDLAHTLACSDCTYEENKRKGYSNE